MSALTVEVLWQIAQELGFNHVAKLALADHLVVIDNIAANFPYLGLGLDISGRVGR